MDITYEVVKKAIELYADIFEDIPTEGDIRIIIEEKMNRSIPLTGQEVRDISNILLEEINPKGRFFHYVETSYGVKSNCFMEV